MNKNSLLSVAILLSAAISCTEEVVPTDNHSTEIQSITAYSTEPGTRTQLSDSYNILWSVDDALALYDGTDNGAVFTSDITEPSAKAVFSGIGAVKLKVKDTDKNNYYAFYPKSALGKFTDNYIYMNLPSIQAAVNGDLAPNTNLLIAESEKLESFIFHNLMAYLKFTIDASSPELISITVSANGGEALSGDFCFEYANANCKTCTDGTNNDFVTLKNEDGSVLAPGTYYMAIKPGSFASGISFLFQKADHSVGVKKVSGPCSIAEGDLMNIGTVDGSLTFESKLVTPYVSGNDKGVVFWVDQDNPSSGKIISGWVSSKVAFSSLADGTDLGVRLKDDDGEINTAAIKATDKYQSKEYSWALDECEKKANGFADGRWYLPSEKECRYLYAAYHNLDADEVMALDNKSGLTPPSDAGYKAFNKALEACGGSGNFSGKTIWTSQNPKSQTQAQTFKIASASNPPVIITLSSVAYSSTATVRCVKKVKLVYSE